MQGLSIFIKKMKRIITLSICIAVSFILSAQERKSSIYSIEVSSGIPPFSGLLISSIGHDYVPEWEKDSQGIIYRDSHCQHLNVAFKWVGDDRWDFVAMLGASTNTKKEYRYRTYVEEIYEDDQQSYPYGHWEGGPDFVKRKFGMGNLYFSGFSRVKYAYTRHAHLYTAFGLGIDLAFATAGYPLMPYISPIGISIGENRRIYGFTELTLGTGGTLILGGIGIRIFE